MVESEATISKRFRAQQQYSLFNSIPQKFLLLTDAQNIRYICAMHMWQSCVEIEDYSVTYFNCIAMFKALYYKTPIKGGAHTHFVDVHASTNYI